MRCEPLFVVAGFAAVTMILLLRILLWNGSLIVRRQGRGRPGFAITRDGFNYFSTIVVFLLFEIGVAASCGQSWFSRAYAGGATRPLFLALSQLADSFKKHGIYFEYFILAAAIGYTVLTFRAGLWYWRLSQHHSPGLQILGRTLVLPVLWGVGAIGTEGFGLPGPILLGTWSMYAWPGHPNYEIIRQTWIMSIGGAFIASVGVVVSDFCRQKASRNSPP